MGLNSILLKMLLSSNTPIMLISEKMLMDDEGEDLSLEDALLNKPKQKNLPYIVPSPA